MFSPKDIQNQVFHRQLQIANQLHSNVYLHCRDAFDDFIQIVRQYQDIKGLVHCFTGNLNQARQLTHLGLKLGITGWLYDNRRNYELICTVRDPSITLDMLVVETDAPFMPIAPDLVSNPWDTGAIIEKIAHLKHIDTITCGQIIYQNSIKMLSKT